MKLLQVTLIITVLILGNAVADDTDDLIEEFEQSRRVRQEGVEEFRHRTHAAFNLLKNIPEDLTKTIECNVRIVASIASYVEHHYLNVATGNKRVEDARKQWQEHIRIVQVLVEDAITSAIQILKNDPTKNAKAKVVLDKTCNVLEIYYNRLTTSYHSGINMLQQKTSLTEDTMDTEGLSKAFAEHTDLTDYWVKALNELGAFDLKGKVQEILNEIKAI